MKLGWYIRVSTADQRESLLMYRNLAQGFCDKYGLKLVEIYCDEDISGGIELFLRPDGKRMKADLDSGRITCIASPNVSRLFRDLRDGMNTLHYTDTNKIKMYVSKGYGTPIDVNTSDGFRMFVTELMNAHLERLQIRERTKDALEHRRLSGMATSHTPYGYKRNANPKNTKLDVDVDEMAVVTAIMDLYRQGIKKSIICQKLNENRIPTKKGGEWHHSTVSKVISYQESLTRTPYGY